jgi:hypothetical protein
MSKLGVGVGEDFPVDDENGNGGAGPQGDPGPRSEADERGEYEDWKRRRDAHRAERDAWRADREEWRARKRAFKRKFKEAIHESFGDSRNWREGESPSGRPYYHWRPRFWPLGAFGISIAALVLIVPILLLVLFFSLISAAFKAPLVILAIFAIGFLIFGMGHRRHGYDRGRRYYYDSDIEAPPRPRPQPRAPQAGTIITPPPAAGK